MLFAGRQPLAAALRRCSAHQYSILPIVARQRDMTLGSTASHTRRMKLCTLRGSCLVGLLVLCVVASAPSAAATSNIITVRSSADTQEEDGLCTLREAIINAERDDAVSSDCETGQGDDVIVIETQAPIRLAAALPPITSTLTLTSPSGAIISGDSDGDGAPAVGILTITESAVVTLQGLVFESGGGQMGGAISLQSGILSGFDLLFRRNRAGEGTGGYGGAISAEGGRLSLTGAEFEDNEAFGVGGALHVSNTHLETTESTFRGNRADFGSAIVALDSNTRIQASTFTRNYSLGSTVETTNGAVELLNVTFDGNTSEAAGALSIQTASAVQSTALARLNHVTIVRTNSPMLPGNPELVGLLLVTFPGTSVHVDVTNSLIESCRGMARGTETVTGSYNRSIHGGGCDPEAFVVPDFLLRPLANNGGPTLTAAPLAGSPVIGQGDLVTCAATDQRGVARPQGVRCDLGAVEATGTLADTAVTPSPTTSQVAPTPRPPSTGVGGLDERAEPGSTRWLLAAVVTLLVGLLAVGAIHATRR